MRDIICTFLAFICAVIFTLLIVFSLFGFVPMWLKVATGVFSGLAMLVWLLDGEK